MNFTDNQMKALISLYQKGKQKKDSRKGYRGASIYHHFTLKSLEKKGLISYDDTHVWMEEKHREKLLSCLKFSRERMIYKSQDLLWGLLRPSVRSTFIVDAIAIILEDAKKTPNKESPLLQNYWQPKMQEALEKFRFGEPFPLELLVEFWPFPYHKDSTSFINEVTHSSFRLDFWKLNSHKKHFQTMFEILVRMNKEKRKKICIRLAYNFSYQTKARYLYILKAYEALGDRMANMTKEEYESLFHV